MKITVSKIGAARSQIIEAIRMFFERRDPISIHTLSGASLQILHDHIDEGVAWDENLFFHFNSIFIKDEYRKEFKDKVNEAKNFFKHADRDLKEGKTTIEFETRSTEFYIFEAIRCLRIVEGDQFLYSPELRVFGIWYMLKYPNHFKAEAFNSFGELRNLKPDNYEDFKRFLVLMAENSSLLK